MSWTPADLGTSLTLWLDAADSNTISLRDNEFVTAWNDKSENADHFAQLTAANQPVYRTGALNGKNVINFVSTDSLTRAAISFNDLGNNSLYVVGNRTGRAGVFNVALILARAANRTRSMLFDFSSANSGRWGSYTNQPVLSPAGFVDATYKICEMIADQNTNSYQFYQGGTSQGSAGVVNTTTGFTSSNCFIGNDQFNSWLEGNIAEVIFCDEKNSDADRQRIEGYLAWKWGGVPQTRLWEPSDLGTSLELWLDADDASTITLNGSNVTGWADKSGNTPPRNATQATASLQPSYNAVTLNGKPTVSQTERGRYMDVAGSASVVNAYAVILATLGDNFIVPGSSGTSAPTSELFALGEIPTDTPNILLSFDGTASTTTGRYRFNGGTLSASNRNHNTTQPSPSNFILEGRFDNPFSLNLIMGRIGLATADTNPMAMGELVWTSSVLSDADRQKLEGYLAHKWGLEANLPVDHPYKDAAPTVTLS